MTPSPQTIIPDRYQTVPRTLSFVTNGDDVLLLRGAPDKRIWPNLYNGVGGHVMPEEDVHTAAAREIREEAGLLVEDLRLRGVINIPVEEPNTGIMVFVFTARSPDRAVQASEEGVPEWVPADRVLELELVEDLPVILPKVLAMGAEDPPFFALYQYDEQGALRITFAE